MTLKWDGREVKGAMMIARPEHGLNIDSLRVQTGQNEIDGEMPLIQTYHSMSHIGTFLVQLLMKHFTSFPVRTCQSFLGLGESPQNG
jgi:hypothetical protein